MLKRPCTIYYLCITMLWVSSAVCAQGSEKLQVAEFVSGDALRIEVFPDTSHFLNGVYSIDMDGNIALPLIGSYNVVSLNRAQLRDFIRSSFGQYLRFPEVQVTPLIRVSMLGGFVDPGFYYIEPQLSLWDLVHRAGGPAFKDGLRRMRWERNKKVISGDLIAVLESGISLSEAGLRSGDQIWTPDEQKKGFWTGVVRDVVIRDVLPIATFMLSLFVSLATIRN